MDRDKFIDLMKNLQTVMKCPACEAVYDVSEIQFVGNQDGYFLLSMTCSKCNLPVWVNVFAGSTSSSRIITDLTVADFELSGRNPIETNEVIDFHRFLKSFRGDFKKHLRR